MYRSRYRRITFFFARVLSRLLFYDIFLPRIGLRRLSEKKRPQRLRRIAQAYHRLAVDMGGVPIKIGQFLSSRADVLPEEITQELSGLQDEVPAEDYHSIKALAEAELGALLNHRFSKFEETPVAAASLGQVHRATLNLPDGEEPPSFGLDVVVKIQRPDIEQIITTDLTAFNTVARWVMRYRPISKRVNVPAILTEFSRILYEEIDYLAEGENAETFAENFKDNPGIRIPGVVWSHTTRRVLTLEDVTAIKINEYQQIEDAAIAPYDVAVRVFEVYMQQIFEHGFFHADPHPGNLFVDPGTPDTGWILTFVDFGMVGRITPSARAGLRELAIGLATKDTQRMTSGYKMLNILLPHADLDLIAQADAQVFDKFWGKSMDELKEISFEEMHAFAKEFRELMYEMPFQVPHDLVFLFKMAATVSGLCTGLAPDFNFWEVLVPHAQHLMSEDGGFNFDTILSEVGAYVQTLLALPKQAENVLGKMARGGLSVQLPAIERRLRRTEDVLRRGVSAILFFAFLTNAVTLYIEQEILFSAILGTGALLSFFGAVFTRSRHS